MKYLSLFYSGAGNTECLAEKIADVLEEQGNEVTRCRLTARSAERLQDDYDALILGFPIYFRDCPSSVSEHLGTLNGRSRPIVLFATKGMYSGNAMRSVLSLAKTRGFVPKGFHEFYMPGSDGLLLFAKKESITERAFKFIHSRKIDRKIHRLLGNVDGDSETPLPGRKWYTFLDEGIVKKVEVRATDHYRIFVRQFHSMPERCTQCLQCVRQCPQGNVTMTEQGVTFGENCDKCFRCVHRCPVEAIQIGSRTLQTVRYRPTPGDF